MNILIILPAPIADLEAIRYWKARMTQQDRLYMMSLRGSKMRRIDGLDIHHLQVDSTKPRPLRSRVVRTVGRWLRFVCPLWNLTLFDFWPEFLGIIRSFNPTSLIFRWMRGARAL